MKTLATLAIGAMLATPVLAEQHTSQDGMSSQDMSQMQGQLIRSRDLTGSPIYTTNEAQDEGWDPDYTYDAVGGDWNEIGEIEDIVLDQSGQMVGIVAEVGGFLDIADKHVVISLDDVNLVAGDDYAMLTRMNEEDLESMESVDEGFWE